MTMTRMTAPLEVGLAVRDLKRMRAFYDSEAAWPVTDIELLDAGGDGSPGQIRVKVNGVDVFHPNSGEIRSAVLMIHGEKAHSRYFSEDAFRKLKGDNKELMIIPGASHVDLYDNQAGVIPFDRIGQFFLEHLK